MTTMRLSQKLDKCPYLDYEELIRELLREVPEETVGEVLWILERHSEMAVWNAIDTTPS